MSQLLANPFRFQPYEGSPRLGDRALQVVRTTAQRLVVIAELYEVAADLTEKRPVPPADLDVEVREATVADMPLFHRKIDEVRERFAAGDSCYVAVHQGRLAYSRWVVRRPVVDQVFGLRIHPAEDEGYLFDAYTAPEYRGRGLHQTVTCFSMNAHRDRGGRVMTGIVLSTNLAARHALARIGFHTRVKINYSAAFDRRWQRVRRVPSDEPLLPR